MRLSSIYGEIRSVEKHLEALESQLEGARRLHSGPLPHWMCRSSHVRFAEKTKKVFGVVPEDKPLPSIIADTESFISRQKAYVLFFRSCSRITRISFLEINSVRSDYSASSASSQIYQKILETARETNGCPVCTRKFNHEHEYKAMAANVHLSRELLPSTAHWSSDGEGHIDGSAGAGEAAQSN